MPLGKPPRQDELDAYAVVGRVLAADVTPFDDNTRPRMVDAIIRYRSDRDPAALEVTTVTDRIAVAVEHKASPYLWPMAIRWLWHVEVGPRSDVPRLRRELPTRLQWFEANDVTHPEPPLIDSVDGPGAEAVGRWLNEVGINRVYGDADPNNRFAGYAHVVPETLTDWIPDDPSRLPAWLTGALREDLLEDKLAKLRESRYAERHLFIYVDRYGLPFNVHSMIAFPRDGLTHDEPDCGDLAAVWLAAQDIRRWVLVWRRDHGWSHHAFEP